MLDYPEFFQADGDVEYDEKAFDKRLRKDGAASRLRRFRDRLAAARSFDAAALERTLHDFVAAEGIRSGEIVHAVRVAVTGRAVGFGLFEGLAILGPEACLARIDRALARVAGEGRGAAAVENGKERAAPSENSSRPAEGE